MTLTLSSQPYPQFFEGLGIYQSSSDRRDFLKGKTVTLNTALVAIICNSHILFFLLLLKQYKTHIIPRQRQSRTQTRSL